MNTFLRLSYQSFRIPDKYTETELLTECHNITLHKMPLFHLDLRANTSALSGETGCTVSYRDHGFWQRYPFLYCMSVFPLQDSLHCHSARSTCASVDVPHIIQQREKSNNHPKHPAIELVTHLRDDEAYWPINCTVAAILGPEDANGTFNFMV